MNVEDVYKSLDAKVVLSLQGKTPKDVYERLDRMYNFVLEKQKLKQWDEAYMMCKRWTDCVEWLKKRKLEKDIAAKYYPLKKQTDVQRLFKDIKMQIESDFMKRHGQWRAKNKPNNLKNDSSQADDELDIALQLPDVPTEEPQPKNKNEITCRELHDIMHNDEIRKKGVLIIDVRAADDFAAGKMAFQDYMININETDILPKKTASYYTSKLVHNDAAQKLFRKRADNDIIVLVDWACAPRKLDTPIAIFRKFLEEHDNVPSYKRIATLKGGFNEWMRQYPELVVRPKITKPNVMDVDQQNEIKKQIDNNFGFNYPPSPSPNIPNTNLLSPGLSVRSSGSKALPFSPQPLSPQVKSNNNINSTLFANDLSSFSDISSVPLFASTPDQIKNNALNTYNPSLLSYNARMSDQPMLSFNTRNQQIIPRSTNPSVLLNDISNYTDIPSSHSGSTPPPATNQVFYPSLNGAPRMKDAKVVLEKLPTPAAPAKPTVDRSNKPVPGRKLSSDNSQIAKIEGLLEDTRSTLAPYERTLLNGRLDPWAKEQYDIYKKREEELCKELEKMKGLGPTASKNGKLYPDLSNNLSGLALNNKPRSTRVAKPNSKNEDKENTNIQQPQVKLERMKMPPTAPLMQRQVTPPQIRPERMDVDVEPSSSSAATAAETYREPLRIEPTTPSSGLKRSYSSPNLQKVKKHKAQHQEERKVIPQVDRSSKPQVQENNDKPRAPALSSQEREERMEPVYGVHGIHPGITGLKNLGNSCYMNSIIQCLSNTAHLAKYFNDNEYTSDLNKKNDRNAAGYVAEEVAQVIKALWRGLYKSISPRDLKVVVGQYKFQFESYDQQDSHEFLVFLLDWLHNDLKKKSKVSYNRELTVAEKEWEKSLEGQSSIISNLFYGQLRSTIECTTCMQTSTTYETFNSLTMSLPTTNKCTLDDCVRKFVSGQKVSGWKCPNCKAPRDGMKKFDLAKLPHIMIIHLNRFGDSGGWLEKKNTAVDFPLASLDLKPYVVSDADNNSPTSAYSLYAMSNHYGTMDGGHYTAYCKSTTRKWYKYDDHTVTEVPHSQVKSQSTSAYLLFYASANMITNS